MKKFLVKTSSIAAILVLGVLMVLPAPRAEAASFNKNNVMDDRVFDDYNTMSASQIQSFLNQFSTSCLKNYKAAYPQSYFTYGSKVSAATVIRRASLLWHINPRVILATLEKEEGLVTGGSGCASWRYNSAMGMGCPDNGACPAPEYAGFSKQVTKGSWQLKFSKERAYGNLSWDGDGSVHYYGYMTQGYRARESGGTSSYYDGHATIDGQNVYMSNGATAALYSYTPHFSGNQHFVTIFSNWFGSTQSSQPIGASLYRQSSNGKIYLVIDGNRFYIPSPATMANYSLDRYSTIPANDSTINSFTDKGSLTNLIYDDSGVYLVNNGKKYPVPSTMCTAWGLECLDGSITKRLGSPFDSEYLSTGKNLTNLMNHGSTYYKMEDGKRFPFADSSTITKLGYSKSDSLNASSVNRTQTLGHLLLTTPGIVKFSPHATIYYFDGTNYYTIAGISMYNAWSMDNLHKISAPKSSYNNSESVPTAGTLSYWYQDANGNKYVIGGGYKLSLSSTQQSLWPSATYLQGLDKLSTNLTAKPLAEFVKSGINYYKLLPEAGEKRYIAGLSNYKDLGVSASNTSYLDSTVVNSIKSGPYAFANGHLIKVQNDSTIYVVNDDKLLHVASMAVLSGYRFNTYNLKVYPLSGVNSYEKSGQLQVGKLSNGTVVIPSGGKLIVVSSSFATESGIQTPGLTLIANDLTKRAVKIAPTRFWRDNGTGKIYYASGGALHYIASSTKLEELGGNSVSLNSVDSYIISLFNIGSPA